jgi:hypothetical protein
MVQVGQMLEVFTDNCLPLLLAFASMCVAHAA